MFNLHNPYKKLVSRAMVIGCLLIYILFKTPGFKNGEYEVKCECDDCFMKLRDLALLLSKADYFLKKDH